MLKATQVSFRITLDGHWGLGDPWALAWIDLDHSGRGDKKEQVEIKMKSNWVFEGAYALNEMPELEKLNVILAIRGRRTAGWRAQVKFEGLQGAGVDGNLKEWMTIGQGIIRNNDIERLTLPLWDYEWGGT